MELKNVIKYQYLNDLLYIFSGALANSWLSTEFLSYGNKVLFLDNYLIEGNTFLYIILYLSFSFVLGVFLRECGEFIYKGTSWLLKKVFNFEIKKYCLETIPRGNTTETDDERYLRFRHIARINAHLIFTGFFSLTTILWIFLKQTDYFILITLILIANSIRNVNQVLLKK